MAWRPCDRVLFIHDGTSACVIASAGLFYERVPAPERSEASGGERLHRGRVDGIPVAIVEIGEHLGVNLRRLCRTFPVVLQELAAMLGVESAQKLLSATPVVAPADRVPALILEHGIHASRFHVPGGWLEGAGRRIMRMPDLDGAPEILWTPLAFPTPIDLYLLRDWWTESVQSVQGPGELSACAGARVGREEYGGDLSTRQLARLGFAPVVESIAPPDARDLAEIAALLRVQDGALDVLGYLDEALSPFPRNEDLDEDGRASLATILSVRGLVERLDAPRVAIETFQQALELAVDPGLQQSIYYNRGYAWLETTALPGTRIPELTAEAVPWATAFPHEPSAEQVRAWKTALADFQRAVELRDEDATAWSQLGLTCWLLGSYERAAGKREVYLSAAVDAFDQAASRFRDAVLEQAMRFNGQQVRQALGAPPPRRSWLDRLLRR